MSQAVSEGVRINQTDIHLMNADITELEVDAFVFYAQSDLMLGSGFGGMISTRGGSGIQKELEDLAPVATGEAVATSAGKLNASHIIHAVGPRFQEKDTESKLRSTMRATLSRAEELGVKRLAFPAMGAGYYGVPLELCAQVMLDEISRHLRGETKIEELIVCVLDSRQFGVFESRLASPA
jgi:O-acetyl-ADP-ribose deacetylase (regulator of RNase III)